MTLSIFGITPKSQSMLILIFGLLVNFFIFYGLTNHFKGVEIPIPYQLIDKR